MTAQAAFKDQSRKPGSPPKPRSIWLLIPEMTHGGMQRMSLNLVPPLLSRGYEPAIVVRSPGSGLWPLVPAGVPAFPLNTHSRLRALFEVTRLLRKHAPDVLVTAGIDGLIAIIARALSRSHTKIIIGQHGPFRRGIRRPFSLIKLLIYRMFLRQADAFVGVCHGVAGDMAASLDIRRSDVDVITNPIVTAGNAALASEQIDHPFFAKDSPAIFVGVGRLVEQKDFKTLLDAFALYRIHHEGRLLLIGDGPLRADLEAQCETLGLSNDVAILGWVSNPVAYMARATALVCTSIFAGLEVVLVEALSVGTPVISTDCEFGPTEVLDGGRFGTLVPVGDAAAIATAMSEVIARDPARAQRAREAGIRRARDFSTETIAQRYDELIVHLCAGVRHAPHRLRRTNLSRWDAKRRTLTSDRRFALPRASGTAGTA